MYHFHFIHDVYYFSMLQLNEGMLVSFLLDFSHISHGLLPLIFGNYISFSQIPTNPAGLIEYRAHPFWNQHYCPSHEHDNTARCCSCERMEVSPT